MHHDGTTTARAPARAVPARVAARALAAAVALGVAAPAAAQVPLRPASPQPQPQELAPGLAVEYARTGPGVRFLAQAEAELRNAKRGKPLVGLDYPDRGLGQYTLTLGAAEFVAAGIEGYLRFDQPGIWRLELHSNDGVALEIGGVQVDRYDSRRRCDTNGWVSVSVPEAGWYPIEASYFQRYDTSCLMMRWEKPDGTREWTPQSAWAYRPD